jgi:hypothetical protein
MHYFLNLHLNHSLQIKSHNEVTKQQKSRVFFIFLLEGRIRIRETNKLTNPDPEHCVKLKNCFDDPSLG